MAQARSMQIPKDVIDSNYRWRKVERAGARQITVGMMEHYSDVQISCDHDIETLQVADAAEQEGSNIKFETA